MPHSSATYQKLGFPLPMNKWINSKEVKEILLDNKSLSRDFYDRKTLIEIIDNKKSEDFDFDGKRIWMLLNVELWLREYFDK